VSTAPLLAEYGAAKSYIAMFSRTLNVELAKSKIHVQCQVRYTCRRDGYRMITY
jgi:short-subunit dehydrogenase